MLFVEEEVGRVFCSENCISDFFTPEVERIEKEYLRRVSHDDLSTQEKDKLSNLRWVTLQEPDEVWREKTLSGDYRYTFISEFKPQQKRVWSLCVCLCLKGEPSFLYLSFMTRNAALASYYRKGERVPWAAAQLAQYDKTPPNSPQTTHSKKSSKSSNSHKSSKKNANSDALEGLNARGGANSQNSQDFSDGMDSEMANSEVIYPTDGLADAWTEDETIRAQLMRGRRPDDIPSEEFSLYQSFAEGTLQSPDEVWSMEMTDKDHLRLYHFIKHYPEERPGIWYLIVARETEERDQIEILDAFPTRDANLVDLYRRGEQEIGQPEPAASTRLVH